MQGTRVLLVDDERDIRWTLAMALKQDGFDVVEATDGQEALRHLEHGTFDVCVADVCMPGLGGFGLVAALRFGEGPTTELHREMPIIMLSGQVTATERARALDAGVDEFLAKPIEIEEFKARLRAVLRRAQQMAQQHMVESSHNRTSGRLSDFSFTALAQALHMAGRDARLRVEGAEKDADRIARIDFRNGQIVHATYEGEGRRVQGERAAVAAFGIEEGTFEVQGLPPDALQTIFADTNSLLLRAATEQDQAGPGFPGQ